MNRTWIESAKGDLWGVEFGQRISISIEWKDGAYSVEAGCGVIICLASGLSDSDAKEWLARARGCIVRGENLITCRSS